MITSTANPRVQWIRRLQRRASAREAEGLFVVEGLRLAEEARRAGSQPRIVLHLDPLPTRAADLVAAFVRREAPALSVSEKVLKACASTESPQGLVLVLPRPELAFPQSPSLVVIADGISDPGNLGALMRTCMAAGVDGLALTPGTVDPYNPKVVRAAMGAHFHLPLLPGSPESLGGRFETLPIWTAEAGGGMPYHQLDARTPLALVVGSEARGPNEAWRRRARGSISIPMADSVESLNAVVAAAVILFEIYRQRGQP